MQRATLLKLQQATQAAGEVAKKTLSNCDSSDIEELLEPLARELNAAKPNKQTLTTYLNSLLKSLQANPSTRSICQQLDSLMQEAHIPSEWEQLERVHLTRQ